MSATGITITITEGVCSTYDMVPAVRPFVLADLVRDALAPAASHTLTLDGVLAVQGRMLQPPPPVMTTPEAYREWRAKLDEHERWRKEGGT